MGDGCDAPAWPRAPREKRSPDAAEAKVCNLESGKRLPLCELNQSGKLFFQQLWRGSRTATRPAGTGRPGESIRNEIVLLSGAGFPGLERNGRVYIGFHLARVNA